MRGAHRLGEGGADTGQRGGALGTGAHRGMVGSRQRGVEEEDGDDVRRGGRPVGKSGGATWWSSGGAGERSIQAAGSWSPPARRGAPSRERAWGAMPRAGAGEQAPASGFGPIQFWIAGDGEREGEWGFIPDPDRIGRGRGSGDVGREWERVG